MSQDILLAIVLPLAFLGLVFLFFFFWFVLLGYYYYRFALKRQKSKSSEVIIENMPDLYSVYRYEKEWFENLKLEDVYITSSDNLKLHGYLNRQDSHTYIIFSHGYRGTYKEATTQLKQMQKIFAPVNILMIDQRAHNLSEGKHLTMGYKEGIDLSRWIDFIVSRDKEAKIILYGQSMGAATIFFAEGYKLAKNVKCAICDSGYTTIHDEFRFICHLISKTLNPNFLLKPAGWFIKKIVKMNINMDEPRTSLSKSKIPTLFIHGMNDTVVSYFFQDQNIKAFNPNTPYERMDIPNAGHCLGFYQDEQKYMDKVEKFVKKYI